MDGAVVAGADGIREQVWFEGQAHEVVGVRKAGGRKSRAGKGVIFSEALLTYLLFENRFDGVESEVFAAIFGLEPGEGKEVLQAASKLRVEKRIG